MNEMPDFSKFLRPVAGNAVKVPPLPQESYPGKISSYEFRESARQKTPHVRLHLVLVGWPDSIPQSQREYKDGSGQVHQIDLARKRFHKDYWLTDDAYYRLDEFYRSCGVDPDGRGDEVLIPMLVGADVTVQVIQQLNSDTNEIFSVVNNIFGSHQ